MFRIHAFIVSLATTALLASCQTLETPSIANVTDAITSEPSATVAPVQTGSDPVASDMVYTNASYTEASRI
jgi:hypothetical protein